MTASNPRTALSVNLNKVALVRNTRHLGIPSVTRAATLCLEAGADGITVHPRPDARHMRAQDVQDLHELLRACAEVANGLKPQLRALLHYHCGVATLHTRRLMIDLQSL